MWCGPPRGGGASRLRSAAPAPIIRPMESPLSFAEARVLGCLVEKEMATPDYYPLTGSALLAACNQLSNREPVVDWDEAFVKAAAASLAQRGIAARVHVAGARVPKYKHRLDQFLPALGAPERALLAVLLLRGPQTAAELRARCQRLHEFPDPASLEAALGNLVSHADPPLVVLWPPGGGRRAATYAHLLCGEPAHGPVGSPETVIEPAPDRVAALEQRVAALDAGLEALRERFERLEAALGGDGQAGICY